MKNLPKKSTKGRKAMALDDKKVILRASIPCVQLRAAEKAAAELGVKFNEFVESALKEGIYKAALDLSYTAHAKPLESLSDSPATTKQAGA